MLKTKSQFFYGCEILENENRLEVVQGSNTYVIDFQAGKYSPEQLANYLSYRLNDVLPSNFEVTFQRQTRVLLFTSDINFSIKIATSSFVGSSIFQNLGLGNTDSPLQLQWFAPNPIGKVFRPQFFLTSYVDSMKNKSLVGATVNETGSGLVEVVRYGRRGFFEFNIQYITNEPQANDFIETNFRGVDDVIDFMDWAIEKRVVEFMPNRDEVENYHALILESTPQSQQGTAYRLDEVGNADGYYETGRLVWREVKL